MTKSNMKATVYERVTAKIIDVLEKCDPKSWERPWHSTSAGSFAVPTNVLTKKPYKGMNTVLLWAEGRGDTWGTYKQWQTLECQVRKGEKGTLCVKWQPFEYKDKETGKKKTSLVPFPFTVFAADQVDGYTAPDAVPVTLADKTKALKAVDKAIKATKIDIRHGGDRAYFSIDGNHVQLPPRTSFKDTKTSTATEGYYSTALHECVHATGHESRLKREFGKRFGDQAYAFEELVAELGAAFACARLGISDEPRPDHAHYLANWLTVLKQDDRAIFTAASKAQQACDWLLPVADQPALDLKEAA